MSRDNDDAAPEQEAGAASYHVDIGHDARGTVVAGHHNLVIDARHGSTVTVRAEHERPVPVRRESISVLPRRAPEPLGRDELGADVAGAIAAGGPVQLCGPAGIGKSTLLRHVACTVGGGLDGVVFLTAAHRPVLDLAQEIFEACYDTHGYAPSWLELRRLLTGLRITVYLDDAELTVEQFRQLADVVPDATFVLAGRADSLLGEGAVHHVPGLSEFAAVQLLARTLNRPLTGGETSTARELWRAAEGNPLLLLRAAALAKSGHHPELSAPGLVEELVPRLIEQLDATAAHVVALLALFEDCGLAAEHVGALAEVEDPVALCERLGELGLVQSTDHGYRCTPDVASAMRHHTDVPVERICRYFVDWARDPNTTSARIADHARVLELVAAHATEAGRPDLAVALGRAVSPKLAESLRFGAWGRILARGWTAARRAGDRTAEAFFTHEEGIRCLVVGRRVAAAALLAEAIVLWNHLGEEGRSLAASEAQQVLPPSPPPPSGPESQADPGSYDVGRHMAELDHDWVVRPEPGDGAVAHGAVGDSALGDGGVGDGVPRPDHVGAESTEWPGEPGEVTGATVQSSGASTVGAHPAAAVTSTESVTAGVTGAVKAGGLVGLMTNATVLFSALLIGLAVIGAVVVAVVVSQDDSGEAEPSATGIAGIWEDPYGGRTVIVESTPGVYTTPSMCGYGEVELYGDDTQATGEAPLIDIDADDCQIIGVVSVTITVDADGRTAQLVQTMPDGQTGLEGEELDCYTCGTFTLTRVQ